MAQWSAEPLFYLDDSLSLERAAEDLWTDSTCSAQAAHERQDLTFPAENHFLTRAQAEQRLAGLPGAR